MFPWSWNWSFPVQLPLSGDVRQVVAPDLSRFFDAIPEQSGKGAVEKDIFLKASYGRQLGWILKIILAKEAPDLVSEAEAAEALAALQGFYKDTLYIKAGHQVDPLICAQEALAALKAHDPAAYQGLVASL